MLLVHVDALFLADARYVQEVDARAQVHIQGFYIDGSKAWGFFFFLKREHVVEPNYDSVTIVAENKRIKQPYQQ